MRPKNYHIVLLAGEVSGDHHAARLIQALKKTGISFTLSGVGGSALKKEGMGTLIDSETLSVIGVSGVLRKLPIYYRALKTVRKALQETKPNILILVDFPDFNLLVAKTAKKLNIPVFYYISPQIWAWRQGRVRKIQKRIDHMAVILPFESDFYSSYHVPVTYVGHPLMDDEDFSIKNLPNELCSEQTIGFLPGSRMSEIKTHLPIMLDAARMIQEKKPEIQFFLSIPNERQTDLIDQILTKKNAHELVRKETKLTQVFKKSRILVAVSGTVTLQAAIWAIPTMIVYKSSWLNAVIGRLLIRVKFIGLANLIAQKKVMPELIQEDVTAFNIYKQGIMWLSDNSALEKTQEELLMIRKKIGEPGAAEKTARLILKLLKVPIKSLL